MFDQHNSILYENNTILIRDISAIDGSSYKYSRHSESNNKDILIKAIVGKKVQSIAKNAFENCVALSTVVLSIPSYLHPKHVLLCVNISVVTNAQTDKKKWQKNGTSV